MLRVGHYAPLERAILIRHIRAAGCVTGPRHEKALNLEGCRLSHGRINSTPQVSGRNLYSHDSTTLRHKRLTPED